MASRLTEIFQRNQKCLIPFVTAGHPNLDASCEIVLALARAGAQIVEIGIPFSDPIADGPVIQKSSFSAITRGYAMPDYIDLVRKIRSKSEVGLIFMSYLNPLWKYGLQRLEQEATEAGLDGLLISDLTPEEYHRLPPLHCLDTVFLAAPTSSDQRLEKILSVCRGFVYLVARTGVTGAHSNVDSVVPACIARIRKYTRLPVAVGFGISSREDVAKVWRHAEGAVVGSALVQFIEDNRSRNDLAGRVESFVRELIPSPFPA